MEFGKFLAYYADAPEISEVRSKKEEGRSKREEGRGRRGEKKGNEPRKAEAGYRRLFINLGKKDGFYPGELMQFLNKNVRGHVEVGHIDLLTTRSYFDVPEEEASRVMKYINGQHYKGREVRCNDADEGNDNKSRPSRKPSSSRDSRSSREPRAPKEHKKTFKKEEWLQFLNPNSMKLKGKVPDFSEEGWAVRKPRKKK
jgi:ATP-dependent RNA helicase DeaD